MAYASILVIDKSLLSEVPEKNPYLFILASWCYTASYKNLSPFCILSPLCEKKKQSH